MRTVVQDKYFLRDLHREIDLYDRKLIHLLKHEVFATEALRDAAVRKLSTKRESLAATARTLVESGIEFHDNDLPRSFRPEGWVGAPADTESSPAEVAVASASLGTTTAPTSAFGTQVANLQRQALREEESPLATALGSWQDDLAAYKKKRQKTAVATAV
ncbi:hypothetical protein [Terriglobus roseus]|uniref:Uncharacterized protein n=1 Tax=Terriglobus roseus TaxID=392734 RepID=A0A1H4LIB6_9BACT|nr:hypothetical protein [Terriglobus roseus]SEB70479.1 hypothetical protein SAMN05443244_1610 [Terriglobus roseus]